MDKDYHLLRKEILFFPTPLEVVASVENQFQDDGLKFCCVKDSHELVCQLKSGRPFLVVLDLHRLDVSVFELLPQLENCLNDCRILVFGGDGDLQTLAIELSKDTVFSPDILNASVLLVALQTILRNGWEFFKRKSVLKSPYFLLFCHSNGMEKVKAFIDQIAPTDIAVLIQGEVGTGKELVAQAIHLRSLRRKKPFIKANCAAVSGELLENELFGFEKGAFTGASARKPGRFELASEGTIFLKEIGDLNHSIQTKLLKVLHERAFFRLGGKDGIPVNTRIITSANSDLQKAVKAGHFREDLYNNLNMASILLPPLRERKEEIPSLMQHFLDLYNFRYGRSYPSISKDSEEIFLNYDWPGNIHELQNAIKQIVVLGDERTVVRDIKERLLTQMNSNTQVTPLPMPAEESTANLKEVGRRAAKKAERVVIQRVLKQTRWNRRAAATLLQISYKALLYKIKEYSLDQ